MAETIESKALRGSKLMDLQEEMIGDPTDGEDGQDVLQSLLSDALTDLRHFCDVMGLDFDRAATMSEFNYNCEVDEDEQATESAGVGTGA